MGAGLDRIHKKIKAFNKKYYLNIFVRGLILSLSILFSYFLLAAVLEHNDVVGPAARLIILHHVFWGSVILSFQIFKRTASMVADKSWALMKNKVQKSLATICQM